MLEVRALRDLRLLYNLGFVLEEADSLAIINLVQIIALQEYTTSVYAIFHQGGKYECEIWGTILNLKDMTNMF